MTTKCLMMACNYPGTSCELRGCINDAENLADHLQKTGIAASRDIKLIREPTGRQIVTAITDLADQTCRENIANVFVSFSGHGTHIADRDGDEDDGRDECLCPSDFSSRGVLSDDQLSTLFSRFSRDTRVSILFDCCHSGTCIDLPHTYVGYAKTRECTRKRTACHPDTIMISGCMDSQTSADAYDTNRYEHTGAMTTAFLDVLKLEPTLISDSFALVCAMRVLLWERDMTQVPQLSVSECLGDTAKSFFRPRA
jgi:hypothetical protein